MILIENIDITVFKNSKLLALVSICIYPIYRYVDKIPKKDSGSKEIDESEVEVKRCLVEMELVCMVEMALSKGSILTMTDIHDGYDALLEERELSDMRAQSSQRKFLK